MILVYFISALILSLGALFIKKKSITKILLGIFLLVQLTFTFYVFENAGNTELIYFTFDALGTIFLTVLTLISIAVVYHGFRYFSSRSTERFFFYHSALIGLIASITGAYFANDVTAVWIFVEATTLTGSMLIYHKKTATALEATWKYIFLCSTGIAIAYLGILFLSMTMTGVGIQDLSFDSIGKAAAGANPLYLKIAFLFVLVGYSTKMELFPMHTVGIDANSEAPSPIGALISTGLVNMGFISIFRVYTALSGTPIFSWMNHILIIVGLLSLLVAAGYELKMQYSSRMLAYSSLEFTGLVAISLGIGGVGYYAAILLLVLHAFVKASLFFQTGQMYRILNTHLVEESGNYMKIYPAGGMVFLIGLVCITAIPPSGIFVAELLIFKSLVYSGNWFVLILSLGLLAFIIFALSNRILKMIFSKPKRLGEEIINYTVKPVETLSQFIFLGIVIFFCFYQPQVLVDLINQSIAGLPK
ncbi:MAG: hydrogenase 4 subunit F [Bacteroidales bacterium]|nr:hydrogenase 4 subunit F [Bacteroidales bacterium]